MNIKIFTCFHKLPVRPQAGPIFWSLGSNLPIDAEGEYLSDLSGINIASRVNFGEMRHQYYVWKNLISDADYVGFEQYRRLLHIDPIGADECRQRYPTMFEIRSSLLSNGTEWQEKLDTDQTEDYLRMRSAFRASHVDAVVDWISAHDIITTRPLFNETIDHQWRRHHDIAIWDRFREVFPNCSYFRGNEKLVDWDLRTVPYHSMYIMRKSMFSEYMKMWSECIFPLAEEFPNAPVRLWPWLSERIFALYQAQKKLENNLLRVSTVPHLMLA